MTQRRRAATRPAGKGGSAAARRRPQRKGGSAAARRRPQRKGGRLRRAAGGDRPYLVALFGLLALIGAMALGPLQNYTAAADRVDALERARDQLRDEVDSLEERRERLHDHEEIETMARTGLGLVRPGEIPFVVVTPEEAQPRVGPEWGEPEAGQRAVPWYHRLGRWLAERFGSEP